MGEPDMVGDTRLHERVASMEAWKEAHMDWAEDRAAGFEERMRMLEVSRIRKEDWEAMSKAVEDLKNFKMKVMLLVMIASTLGSALGSEGLRSLLNLLAQ